MNNIETWNYEKSIQELKPNVYKLKNLTTEIVEELWVARQVLSSQGHRSDLVTNDTKLTFEKYCIDIGIARMTAYRWLERYLPEENKLLTTEEHQEYKKKQEIKDRNLLTNFVTNGIKGNGWTSKHDKMYQKLFDKDEFEKRKEKVFKDKKRKKDKEDFEAFQRTQDEVANNTDHIFDKLYNLLDDAMPNERNNLKLDNAKDTFSQNEIINMIETYIYSAESITRQLELTNNLIKHLRTISIELNQKTSKAFS